MNGLGSVNSMVATSGASPPPAAYDGDDSSSNAAFSGVLDRVSAETSGTHWSAPYKAANSQTSQDRSRDASDRSKTTQDQPKDDPKAAAATAAGKARAASPSSAADISALAQAVLNGTPRQPTGASASTSGTTPASADAAGKALPTLPAADATDQAAAKALSTLPGATQGALAAQPGDPGEDAKAKAVQTSTVAGPLGTGASAATLPPSAAATPATARPLNAVTTKTSGNAAQPAPSIVNAAKSVSPQGSDASGSRDGNDGTGKRGGSSAAPPPFSVSTASTVSPSPIGDAVGPAQQIVTALQSLRTDMVTASTQSPGSVGGAMGAADVAQAQTGPTPSVKTLTIELNPANLGPVSITMRMLADSVDIRIAVANPQTLHLLDKDKHLLSAAVEAAGGSRDTLQIGAPSNTSGSENRGASGQPQPQGNGGRSPDGFSSNASSSGGQPSGRQDRSTSTSVLQSENDEKILPSSSRAGRTDGSLYL